jgi:Protein of unknown function (DUF1640)
MISLAFDTHASVKKLKEAGFTEQQAEAQVQVLLEILGSNLVTKEDIAQLERATKEDLHTIKTDLAVLKAELGIVKWFLGSIGFGVVLLLLRAFWPVVAA